MVSKSMHAKKRYMAARKMYRLGLFYIRLADGYKLWKPLEYKRINDALRRSSFFIVRFPKDSRRRKGWWVGYFKTGAGIRIFTRPTPFLSLRAAILTMRMMNA